MKPSDLKELHYIAPIANVPSILQWGILSHNGASEHDHVSVAMVEVQERRDRKSVFNTRPLHSFVNLYIDARNPMMYKLRDMNQDLCVLRVDAAVLNLRGIVIADGNAAHSMTVFEPTLAGLGKVEAEKIFAEFWSNSNKNKQEDSKRVKCAEVLIPDTVDASLIQGAYVSCKESGLALRAVAPHLKITVKKYLFFVG